MKRWLVPLGLAAVAHAALAAIPMRKAGPDQQVVRLALRAPAPAAQPADAIEIPAAAPATSAPSAAAPSAATPAAAPREAAQTADEALHIESDPAPHRPAPAARMPASSGAALDRLGTAAPPPAPAPAIDPAALDAYAARVRRALEGHKRYPHRARTLGHEGTTIVTLAIAADGSLAAPPSVTGSSRSALLDREAERMAAAAAPFEPPPPGRAPLRVAVPVVFAIH